MASESIKISLEYGVYLREFVNKGSVLNINEDIDEIDYNSDQRQTERKHKALDILGKSVSNFDVLGHENIMVAVDENGYVKKKVLEEGGGLPPNENCTVSIAFSGYSEGESEPFEVMACYKPMDVDLQDNGLLPGLQMAIKSMLVGEIAVFLLSYHVMYGEMGVPPRIKPKTNCIFYIKMIRSIITPQRKIIFSEPNMFGRVYQEVNMLFSSGKTLYKSNNYSAAIQLFRKAVYMLHKCHLADENEEKKQERLLIKLYINLVVCYIKIKKPLLACTMCNELKRLSSFWSNGKVIFLNAKAMRMIGEFDVAEKRLKRAMKLCPGDKEILAELKLLEQTRKLCNQSKVIQENCGSANNEFKQEVERLIKNFKESGDIQQLTLSPGLNSSELSYIKEVCLREKLFFKAAGKNLGKDDEDSSLVESDQPIVNKIGVSPSISSIDVTDECYVLDKDNDLDDSLDLSCLQELF